MSQPAAGSLNDDPGSGVAAAPPQYVSTAHVAFIATVHVGAFAALWHFTWSALATAVVLYVLTGLGITVGYHRLLSHRSFKASRWLTRVWATLGCAALQGGPLRWAADHRAHHFYSDTEGDPHSIDRGFFFAHVGWVVLLYPTDFDRQRILARTRDLARDPYLRWLEDHPTVPGLGLAIVLVLVGGLPFLLWAFCARLVMLYHSTWLVNSAAHLWGYRNFETATGTNNWIVAALAFGEGWHNNHHAWPSSARQGLKPWELDPSWGTIVLMRKLGLVEDVMEARLDPGRDAGAVMVRS